jgi:hypothetical protein
MGHHDADPASHRHYVGFAVLSVTVLMLLFVGVFALNLLSQH